MFTTLSTALSALNANSIAVSVVGNDLANLDTTGYKSTEVAFQDLMAESMGGINGFSLGMGTAQPQTIRQFSQGSLQTGLGGLNAAIQGQGFFMVKDANGNPLYTRDGTFTTGSNGYLVDANGLQVQGWSADANGVLNTNGSPGAISIPAGTLFPPVASSEVSLSMNLNAAAIAGTTTGTTSGTFSQPITVYDSLGTAHTLTATFSKNEVQTPLAGSAPAVAISGTDTAVFTVSTGAGTQTITVDSADGTVAGQVAELNTKLQSYGITASLDSTGKLQFASANAFSISGISSGAANLVPDSTGTAVTANNSALNSQLITPTGPDALTITAGGQTVTVANVGSGSGGAPTAADVTNINNALKAQGITGVTAVLDETTATGGSPTAIALEGTATFSATDTSATMGNYSPMGSGAQNTWNYSVTMPGSDLASGVTTTVASGQLTFDPKTGQLLTPIPTDGTITLTTGSGKADTAGPLSNGATMNDITWDLYDSSGNPLVTQVDQASAVSANTADGSAAAQLTQVTMGDGGQLMAQFSNGKSVAIAQLSIANIPNPNSMLAVGNNDFEASSQTAAPIIGTAGTGGRGSVTGGALEQSTVDIATEFSQLITLQNAYQANSRVVTTEDQILQQTVSLVQP
jgi:flagellar hook protein FlgE